MGFFSFEVGYFWCTKIQGKLLIYHSQQSGHKAKNIVGVYVEDRLKVNFMAENQFSCLKL